MADTRVFRVTKYGYKKNKITFHTRTSISGMFARGFYLDGSRPDIAKVEATNAEATEGWTDVTEEFRGRGIPSRS